MSDWKANRLHVLRAERRMSQVVLGRRLRLPQTKVSRLEHAIDEPDDKLRARIAKVFGVPESALYREGAAS